jgi:acid phosphatase (class A)
MSRLGASNTNTNTNTNTVFGASQAGVAGGIRYNSQEFPKVLDDRFPAELPSDASPAERKAYAADQDVVNKVTFRTNWDAELRASVYLNEFIVKNPDWLETLISAIREKHGLLHQQKGEQLRAVIGMSDEREPRFVEIIDQHEGEGALKYWLGMLMIDPGNAPAAYELIRVGRRIGEVVVMCLKHHFREARPSQVCPAIVPMVDPPITPSFPAGHALQSHLISRLIEVADRPFVQPDMLYALSKRVAENRIIAGLHYPLDNEAGVIAANLVVDMLQTDDATRRCPQFRGLLEEAKAESRREREGKS